MAARNTFFWDYTSVGYGINLVWLSRLQPPVLVTEPRLTVTPAVAPFCWMYEHWPPACTVLITSDWHACSLHSYRNGTLAHSVGITRLLGTISYLVWLSRLQPPVLATEPRLTVTPAVAPFCRMYKHPLAQYLITSDWHACSRPSPRNETQPLCDSP